MEYEEYYLKNNFNQESDVFKNFMNLTHLFFGLLFDKKVNLPKCV